MENTNVENRQLKKYIRDNLKSIAFNKDWTDYHLEDNHKKLLRFCAFENYGELDIQSIAAKRITNFAMHLLEVGNYRMKKGLSSKSVNRYMAAISNVFKHALIQDDT